MASVAHDRTRGGLRIPPEAYTGALLVVLATAASFRFPGFASSTVLFNLLTDQAVLGLLALGMIFVIVTGGIDLSVGSLMAATGMLTVYLLQQSWIPDGLALVVPVSIAALAGYFQGRLVADLKLPPFLVTLGGLFVFQGLANMTGEGSIQSDSPTLSAITNWSIGIPAGGSISAPTVVLFLGVIATAFLMRQTRFGRTAIAIGGVSSAEEMGLPVRSTLIRCYALSGFCAGLAGLVYVIFNGSGEPLAGQGRELEAISAVVIGGASLAGGSGSILGAMLGVLTIGVIQQAIIYDGTLSSWWGKIVVAGLLGAFLLAQAIANRKRA